MESSLRVITPYGRRGASSRVRVFDWLDHLGIAAKVHDYAGLATNTPRSLAGHPIAAVRAELELRRLSGRVTEDTVLMSKQSSPFSNGDLERALLSRAKRGVYDFDDALANETRYWPFNRFSRSRIWSAAVMAADQVIAGNNYLAGQALELVPASRVSVIPSCVEPRDYPKKQDYEIGAHPRAVWLGSPGTEKFLAEITPALLSANHRHGLTLTVISRGARDLGSLGSMVRRVSWTPQSIRLLRNADFGIMPLLDTPQARGKCAYKLLQYGASALPAIASPIGANREVAGHLATFLATGDRSWRDSLEDMIGASAHERRMLGEQGLSGVTREYSFGAWSSAWRDSVFR